MTRNAVHLPLLAVVAVAAAVRVAALAGYPSVLWFGDSGGYLRHALDPSPSTLRPWGYSFFLLVLGPARSLTAVAAVQHLLGLATGLLVYLVVWRAAAPVWPRRRAALLATAAAVPVLLDAYQVQLEHLLMSDALFVFLTVAAAALAVSRFPERAAAGVPLGLLLGAAAVTRTVGVVVAAVLLAWLLLRRPTRRAAVAAGVVLALCLAGYAGWFRAEHGRFAVTGGNGVFLYNRVAAFADCGVVEARLRALCTERLRGDPATAPGFAAVWGKGSPLRHVRGGVGGRRADRLAGAFARRVLLAQPGDYARTVVGDTLRTFTWRRGSYPTAGTVARYRFPERVRVPAEAAAPASAYAGGRVRAPVVDPWAGWVRAYQRFVFLPGVLLGVLLAAAPAVLVARRGWRSAAVPLWLVAAALLVAPVALADFDYRYTLPVVPFAAAALAVAVCARRGPVQ